VPQFLILAISFEIKKLSSCKSSETYETFLKFPQVRERALKCAGDGSKSRGCGKSGKWQGLSLGIVENFSRVFHDAAIFQALCENLFLRRASLSTAFALSPKRRRF